MFGSLVKLRFLLCSSCFSVPHSRSGTGRCDVSLLEASGSINFVTKTGVHRPVMQKLWCLVPNLLLAVSQVGTGH